MNDDIWRDIEHFIGDRFRIETRAAVAGGCINDAVVIGGSDREYFVKINHIEAFDMFESEMEALKEIALTNTVIVPQPVGVGRSERRAFIVMERLALTPASSASLGKFGAQLAALHQVPRKFFGWHRDNAIGSTPQMNEKHSDWAAFWSHCRLQPQLRLAESSGYRGKWMDTAYRLCSLLPVLFESYRPLPSLLHGDLWSGNVAADSRGNPVVFDPACYYGDRECDLAMTELFGGFDSGFYASYNAVFLLDEGYASRKHLYNLYHLLNHLNLFGDRYLGQVESSVYRLGAEV